jgi:hypothetical protein
VAVAEMALQHGEGLEQRALRHWNAGFYALASEVRAQSVLARKLATVAQFAGVLGAAFSAAMELVV